MRLLLCFLFALFVCYGCKKDKIPGDFFGSASATLNGKSWTVSHIRTVINTGCFNGNLSIQLNIYNNQGFQREALIFSKVEMRLGSQTILNRDDIQNPCNDTLDAGYYTHGDDGDVLVDVYAKVIGADNKLQIDKIDPLTEVFNGSFSVSFAITRRQSPDAPDTLHFRDGKFLTKVLK